MHDEGRADWSGYGREKQHAPQRSVKTCCPTSEWRQRLRKAKADHDFPKSSQGQPRVGERANRTTMLTEEPEISVS